MVVKPTGNAGWFWGLFVAMVAGIAHALAAAQRTAKPAPVAAPG